MKKRFSETQIVGLLPEAGAGVAVTGLAVNHKRVDRIYRDVAWCGRRSRCTLAATWAVMPRALVHECAARPGPDRGRRQEYNQERPKRALGGLTPAAFAVADS